MKARPRVAVADTGSGNLRSVAKVLAAIRGGRPYLGICLGLQVLFEGSEEDPGCQGLGVLPGRVRRFAPAPGLKIPHMGWNATLAAGGGAPSPVLAGTPTGTFFYFLPRHYPRSAPVADVA